MTLASLLLALAAGPALTADDLKRITDEVRCAEIGFSQSVENQDSEAFAGFVDPDARFVSGQTLRGRAAIVEGWSGALTGAGREMRWRPRVVEVLPSGDLALSRGPYRVRRFGEDGSVRESWGHFISTWRRSPDGRWRVIFDTGGDDGMTPSDEEKALIETNPCSNEK